MKIYPREKSDGLAESLSNSKICYSNLVQPINTSFFDLETISKSIAQNQIDLHYLQTVLVSTGWNRNDDVFDKGEVWQARATPEDKPFNYEHNEKDIIGHITACKAVDFAGSVLTGEEVPSEDFNIITSAVLYKTWEDKALQDRMNSIVEEIAKGSWFVSMECLFDDFDYMILDTDGNEQVEKRTKANSYLTKYLRAYGGTGVYDKYRIGRILKNIVFSGKGLVRKPANPNSIILSIASEIEMEEKEVNEKISNLDKKNQELEKVAADLKVQLQDKDTKFADLVKQLADKNSVFEQLTKDYGVLKFEVTKAKRLGTLKDNGFADPESYIDAVMEMSDDAFAKFVDKAKPKKVEAKEIKEDKPETDKAESNAKLDLFEKVKSSEPDLSKLGSKDSGKELAEHISKFLKQNKSGSVK